MFFRETLTYFSLSKNIVRTTDFSTFSYHKKTSHFVLTISPYYFFQAPLAIFLNHIQDHIYPLFFFLQPHSPNMTPLGINPTHQSLFRLYLLPSVPPGTGGFQPGGCVTRQPITPPSQIHPCLHISVQLAMCRKLRNPHFLLPRPPAVPIATVHSLLAQQNAP